MNKTWLWILIVVVVLIVLYFVFAGPKTTSDTTGNLNSSPNTDTNTSNSLYYNDQAPNIENESALDAENSPVYAAYAQTPAGIQ